MYLHPAPWSAIVQRKSYKVFPTCAMEPADYLGSVRFILWRLILAALLFEFCEAFLQIILIFLEQLGILGRGVDFGRFVFSFIEFLLGPFIVDANLVGPVEYFSYKLWRNEIYAFAIPHHEIAVHNGYIAYADGHIDAR